MKSPQTIAVLGAGGKTGKLVVTELLKKGFLVKALYRKSPASTPEGVTVIIGSATSPEIVTTLTKETTACISCLGHTRRSGSTVQRDAITALLSLNLPPEYKVLFQTGVGIPIAGDSPAPLHQLLTAGLSFVDPQRLSDASTAVALLTNSSITWTIIRCPLLTQLQRDDFILTKAVSRWFPLFVSRAAVSKAMVKCITTNSWDHSFPAVCHTHHQG